MRATELILTGTPVVQAVEDAASAKYDHLPATKWLALAKEAAAMDDHLAASTKLGLTCHVPEAFPGTLHYALRFPNNLPAALSHNALAAGDNSSRGMDRWPCGT